jgi:outer membrane receptor protein involved in Fe transport
MIDYTKEVYHQEVGYVYSKDVIQIYLAGGFETMKQNLDLDNSEVIDRKYDNFLPTASINYEIKKGQNIRFRYRRQTLLPSALQVTPMENNFNPLYITYGNTELTPEESDNYNIRLRSHNFQKGTSMFGFINYSKTENAIVSKREIFDDYRQESTYENFGSKSNLRGMMHMSRKIPKLGMRYNLFLFASVNDYHTIINAIPNKTKTKSNTIGINIGNDNKNKVDLQVGARFETNRTTYSTQGRDRDFFKQNYNTRFDIDITDSFSFNTQFDYSGIQIKCNR